MIDFKLMVEEQDIRDVISFLVKNVNGYGYPQMDRFFCRHKFSLVGDGVFMRVFAEMENKGEIQWGEKIVVKKGPNWKEPKFVTQKKYGIE
ncbi:hypothetical protein [Rosenbergiella collisarenosi]|uniref:hypothetical protein n=1 Tax=Rosenbergiella collisarenosi TaxID=1544695 RepID=UPI001F500E00|nr:hypothetical protein [Rosenbergiella collisarenosi]